MKKVDPTPCFLSPGKDSSEQSSIVPQTSGIDFWFSWPQQDTPPQDAIVTAHDHVLWVFCRWTDSALVVLNGHVHLAREVEIPPGIQGDQNPVRPVSVGGAVL